MDLLKAAQDALNAGRVAEAIAHLKAAIDADPARPSGAFRVLAIRQYQAGDYADGAAYAAIGVRLHPRDFELWNTYGVLLRRLKRYPEAVVALEHAIKINPKNPSAATNLGNVLLDMDNAVRAEQVFAKLARQDPRTAEHQRQLGRALLKQGKREPAFVRFRSAVALKKDFTDAWLDMVGALNEEQRSQ